MAEPVALAALAVEAAVGWPAPLYRTVGHPVGLFARILAAGERRFNAADTGFATRRLAGALTLLLVVAVATGIAVALEWLARLWLGHGAWMAVALLAVPGLAQRSLDDHVRAVFHPLAAGDLEGARRAVAMIVGRDTAALDEAGVTRAAIESLAESFCDGIVAPAFWLLIGGLPGLWAYKAINTADSLIGHKEERWRAFGWAAARTDDVANLAPARLSALLLCLAGRGGWATMLRDHRLHASPNAGWPEAAMAGVLRLRLAGPVAYDRVVHDKAWIGSGTEAATARDIGRALRVYRRACLLLWLIAGGAAWAL
ncbi:adenosylcobinamide-phosphate synthase CbiB [Sphingosinicella sp. BN140058]|uniref:adenosylcobinamide-phosphate synthase CbiB n=1 Tax=Sphingosinicella sp. BN140058 TaxID=1892855 RepID=UPI001FB0934F|nr:adenosylcobinamide-phosphate synthase CbiB [Sphingosinicella sp. BN140058]